MFILFLIVYMLIFNILILSKISFGFTGAAVGTKTGSVATDILMLSTFNIAIILLFTLSYSSYNFFHEKEARIATLKKLDDPVKKKKRK